MNNRNENTLVQNKRKSDAILSCNDMLVDGDWAVSAKNHEKKICTSSENPPLNWFEDKNSFVEACQKIDSRYAFVSQFIIKHTTISCNQKISWITWPQEKYPNDNMYLKLEFSTFKFKTNPEKEDYHSWLFSEDDFLKLHSYTYAPESREYFRFKVYEEIYSGAAEYSNMVYPPLNHSNQILDVWFSQDSSFGELRDLKKGEVLSGTEVMSAFDFLNENLLKIQTTYLCDASRSNGDALETAENQIVFRILMSVAYGKTWYEKCGYEAFQFNEFKPGWPEDNIPLYQDSKEFNSARKRLMKYLVSDLYEMLLKKEKDVEVGSVLKSSVLLELSKKYGNHDPSSTTRNKSATLSILVSAVYDAFKRSKDMSDLLKMYSLLIVPEKYLKINSATPAYYKNLCYLNSTRFFRKKMNPVQINNEFNSDLTLKLVSK